MNRRDALRWMAAAPLALSARLQAASAAGPKLLVVFLRGGYDALSVLVPTASAFYAEARPTIALAPPGSGADAAVALEGGWALHPALAASLQPFYAKRELAFVPFAGTDDASRSHFETQDGIELGQPLGPHRALDSGFLNRLAAELPAARPLAFTDQLPLVFRGEAGIANAALRGAARTGFDPRQRGLIAGMYQGTALDATVREGFALREEVAHEMADEMAGADRGATSARGFGQEARRIGRMMREKVDLGFVDVGGWDTHVGQGAGQGVLARRLEELGAGLAGFAEEMGPAWRDTVVVVMSEFGRTARENGSRGTDHGHGTAYWFLGGAVRGGRVAGEQVAVERASLFQDRDLPVLNEYRALLGGIFARLYGLSPAALARVFPGAAPRDLGLV